MVDAFGRIRSTLGPVEIMVNNAGLGYRSPLCSGDAVLWREMLEVNVIALSVASREAVRQMQSASSAGHIVNISSMAAHRVPYIATASVAYPEDMIRKFKRAKKITGTRFFHVLSPCPVGWRAQPHHTIKLARLAVQTRLFPLLEIEGGTSWRLTIKVRNPKPLQEYLALQGRFKHLTVDEVAGVQNTVDANWREIEELAARSAPAEEPEPSKRQA